MLVDAVHRVELTQKVRNERLVRPQLQHLSAIAAAQQLEIALLVINRIVDKIASDFIWQVDHYCPVNRLASRRITSIGAA